MSQELNWSPSNSSATGSEPALLYRLASEQEMERRSYALKAAERVLVSGVQPDLILRMEQILPGSDDRLGVNLIARPPVEVVKFILRAQRQLKSIEPDQYYYPWTDLHLTVKCLGFECSHDEINEVVSVVQSLHEQIFSAAQAPYLVSPSLVVDEHTVSLQFLDLSRRLLKLRTVIGERFRRSGITTGNQQYYPVGHINFLRYTRPLQTDANAWLTKIQKISVPDFEWTISKLYLTWGAPRYGMHNRICQSGPYELAEDSLGERFAAG
jgi:2'-5' RNA ligase